MRNYEKRHHNLAYGIAALAGFVDSLGFLKLGGPFVSFMSGNSTRLAVGVASGDRIGLVAALLIAAFVTGVVAGALLGEAAGRWRKQAVLGLVTFLLLLASTLAMRGLSLAPPTLLMAFAMGAANNVFQRDGEVSIGVTYMTGTLVKLGQKLAAALTGGPPFEWVPYLLLWGALIAGAVAGAAAYPWLGLHALWIASGFAMALLAAAFALGPLPAKSDGLPAPATR